MSGKSPEELQAEIVEQREALSATVHELGTRLDVKRQVKDRATTDAGKPRPELIAGAAMLVAAVVGLVVWRVRR